MKIIVFLGAPGSGKGTQAKSLADRLGFIHFSTGDMLREAIQRKEPVGVQANQYIVKGELVPDPVMIELIENALSPLNNTATVVLDGFPRTLPQAKALDSSAKTKVSIAVSFSVPQNVLVDRLTGRRICKQCGASYHTVFLPPKQDFICDKCQGPLFQRPDDNQSVVVNRLKVFESQNADLLKHYESTHRLVTVNGDRPVNVVQSDLDRLLG